MKLAYSWLVGAAVAALVASPAMAQQKVLRFGHLHSVDSPVHKGIAKAAEEVEKATQGRYKINIFPSSQLGQAREMVQQVVDGNLDFISEGPGSLSALHRPLSVFEAPFIARDYDHLLKMLESDYAKEQLKVMETQRNMAYIGTFYYGVRHFTTKGKALQTAADVKGLKIRVPEAPLFLAMIRALEATPTPMSLGEVYLSLQTGVADGQENPLPTINNNKFFEVQKFLNLTGHVIVPIMIMMNNKVYAAATPADQAAFKTAFLAGAKVNDDLTRADEASLVDAFKAKGMTVVNSDRDSFRARMTSVYELGEKDWGAGTYQKLQAIK